MIYVDDLAILSDPTISIDAAPINYQFHSKNGVQAVK